MANIVRRAIGPNDAGIPEDEIRDIIIPLHLPEGIVLIDPNNRTAKEQATWQANTEVCPTRRR